MFNKSIPLGLGKRKVLKLEKLTLALTQVYNPSARGWLTPSPFMTPKTSPQPENSEIMEAIHVFAESVDQRFAEVHSDIKEIRTSMVTKGYLEERLQKFQTSMVTKDYLDDKLADLRGDLIILTRRPNNKVDTLVDVLHEKRVITDADVERVTSASR